MEPTFFLVAAILLGACVGSFLNVVIYRVPTRTFFAAGKRSICPRCRAPIVWFDNLPVFSWVVLLRGKARCCGERISPRYPLVEALTAATFGVLFWTSLSSNTAAAGWPEWGAFTFHAWFLSVLIACTFIDIDHRLLPDVLTKPTMVVGLVGAAAVPGLVTGFSSAPDWFDQLLYSVVGMLAGLLLTSSVRTGASKIFGREAMGLGDVKFMGAIGAFVGWDGVLSTFFLGSLFGAVYGGLHALITKDRTVFFGPFLAAGAVITLFFKPAIIRFVTVTWPTWQANLTLSPWVFVGIGLALFALLVLIIRRGRRD